RNAQVAPTARMTGKQQDLVASGSIEQDPFHLLEAIGIAVHEGIIENQQRRATGGGEQVGIGQATDQAHLLARAEAEGGQFALLPGVAVLATETLRDEVFV